MRIWLSGPRILGGLLRPGVSFGREDGLRVLGGRRPARLPSYRRYELRHGLQEAAKARGEKLTKEDCDYAIDKGLATGLLDSDGNLNFIAKGSREEIIGEVIKTAEAWGKPMTHAEAEATADAGIAEIERQRRADVIGLVVGIAGGLGIAIWIFYELT